MTELHSKIFGAADDKVGSDDVEQNPGATEYVTGKGVAPTKAVR